MNRFIGSGLDSVNSGISSNLRTNDIEIIRNFNIKPRNINYCEIYRSWNQQFLV